MQFVLGDIYARCSEDTKEWKDDVQYRRIHYTLLNSVSLYLQYGGGMTKRKGRAFGSSLCLDTLMGGGPKIQRKIYYDV